MSFSPCSNRLTVSGQSGSSQASKARFEQLPLRIQTRERPVTQEPTINKVFVFSNHDGVIGFRALPDRRIISSMKTHIIDVSCLVTSFSTPTRQGRRQLGIHEKVHAGCRTA